MRRDHHETKLNGGKTFQCMGKRIWTHNHGLDISCTLWYFTFGILNAKRPSREKIKWWQDFSMHGKTNHGLDISCTLWYFQEEAINNFSNGKKVSFQWAVALIVFHLHLWYKVMVSYTYQLFLSHFLLWNVRYDLNRIPRYCFFNYLFKILSCEFFIMR